MVLWNLNVPPFVVCGMWNVTGCELIYDQVSTSMCLGKIISRGIKNGSFQGQRKGF